MNSVVRQEPWSLMPRLQDEINRLFGNMQQTDGSSSATAPGGTASGVTSHGPNAPVASKFLPMVHCGVRS